MNVPDGFLKILSFGTVPENKGFMEEFDGYEKYDPEENADQWLINSGGRQLYSKESNGVGIR